MELPWQDLLGLKGNLRGRGLRLRLCIHVQLVLWASLLLHLDQRFFFKKNQGESLWGTHYTQEAGHYCMGEDRSHISGSGSNNFSSRNNSTLISQRREFEGLLKVNKGRLSLPLSDERVAAANAFSPAAAQIALPPSPPSGKIRGLQTAAIPQKGVG